MSDHLKTTGKTAARIPIREFDRTPRKGTAPDGVVGNAGGDGHRELKPKGIIQNATRPAHESLPSDSE
jgi:hypothetical protein